jgi:hypothetical protein
MLTIINPRKQQLIGFPYVTGMAFFLYISIIIFRLGIKPDPFTHWVHSRREKWGWWAKYEKDMYRKENDNGY